MSFSSDPSTNTPIPGEKPRVLVVDDESIVRAVTRMMLERVGYAVEEAGNAAEALTQLASAVVPFAAVLLDHTLPDHNGKALVPELRKIAPASRLVLMSGRPEEDLADHGADGYLAKPFTKTQLAAVIRGAATAPS